MIRSEEGNLLDEFVLNPMDPSICHNIDERYPDIDHSEIKTIFNSNTKLIRVYEYSRN